MANIRLNIRKQLLNMLIWNGVKNVVVDIIPEQFHRCDGQLLDRVKGILLNSKTATLNGGFASKKLGSNV